MGLVRDSGIATNMHIHDAELMAHNLTESHTRRGFDYQDRRPAVTDK